ncbi:MAG: isoprenylcysteine carboxylmethyltransferase family protein [Candidatus Gygaella obscura]|nr:isoprenylcysteine carboxylmethyltransferase family protein [Candidatus Gygaella obscura]
MNNFLLIDILDRVNLVVFFTSILLCVFVLLLKPQTKTEKKNMALLSTFLLVLFIEMFGFPVTVYLLSSWLKQKSILPVIDFHKFHLVLVYLGLEKSEFARKLLLFSFHMGLLIGFILLFLGWKRIYQKNKQQLVTTSIYRYLRHPQYAGLLLICFIYFIKSPTLPSMVMFFVLLFSYVWLARREDNLLYVKYKEEFIKYKKNTGAFFPRLFAFIFVMVFFMSVPGVGFCQAQEFSYFGIGYGNRDFDGRILRQQASFYKDTDSNWVRFIDITWDEIEPSIPTADGIHSYDWERLDFLINEWQNAGFDIQLAIDPYSSWAANERAESEDVPSFLWIKEENKKHFQEFIFAMAARYDADGSSDMPNIQKPIFYYSIGTREIFNNFCKEDYRKFAEFIKFTSKTLKEANPKIKVILSGIDMGNIFDERVKRRQFHNYQGKLTQMLFCAKRFIKLAECADVIELRCDCDYTGIPDAVNYIKEQLNINNITIPVWASVNLIDSIFLTEQHKYSSHFFKRARLLKKILQNKRHKRYDITYEWLTRQQSNILFKKTVMLKAFGVDKVNFQSLENSKEGNYSTGIIDIKGKKRPSFYALKLMNDKLGQAQFLERLNLGPGVYAFKFRKENTIIYALWNDAREFLFPWESYSRQKVILKIPAESARVTLNFTRTKQSDAVSILKPVRNNILKFVLEDDPIIVEYTE